MLIPFKFLIANPEKIRGIIHIGAHELEELKVYLEKKVERIIWIEANPEKYKLIEKKIKKYNNMILGKFAAGSKKNKVKLNIADNGQSSSILEFGTHKKSYPNISYLTSKEVDVIPLDNWIDENNENRELYNFVNIDIQGYELEALKGMIKQLKYVDYLYLEVNFRQVYKNCSELKDIDNFLNIYGFKRVGMFRTNKGWGDAIYKRNYIFLNRLFYLFFIPFWRLINLPIKLFIKLKREKI